MRLKTWLWIGACVVVLSAATLAMLQRTSASWLEADMVRGVQPVTDASQPPSGYFHQLMDDGQADGPLTVRYRSETSAQGNAVLVIALDNQSRRVTNYNLFLASSPTDVVQGGLYRISAQLSATDSVRTPLMLGLGFQLYQSGGQYLGDTSPASAMFTGVLGADQPVQASWLGGTRYEQQDKAPSSLLPRLSLYNIPPGFVGEIRLTNVGWQTPAATQAKVEMASPQSATPAANAWTAAAGQMLPLQFALAPQEWAPNGASAATLTLRAPSGRTQAYPSDAPVIMVSDEGQALSTWQVRVPADWPAGASKLLYAQAGSSQREIGDVSVSGQTGVFIGHAFHRYPGASEKLFGPLSMRYQFARSLANDLTYLNQWWTGDGDYDWRGIDRWADFHAGTGQRRLLITFSGSPRWASQSPQQAAAMGQPGNAAPPRRELFAAYERMVRDTVSRYKDRLLAVECWNEPNSPDFFTGTQTDLADLCQLVHDGARAVAPQLPVICPQADSPETAAFVYEARTSKGDSILSRCDVVGAHIYNRLGHDTQGRWYAAQRLDDSLELLRKINQRHGVLDKPIAVTEYGVSSCVTQPTRQHPQPFGSMPSTEAGDALYQSLGSFREKGVWMVALYSFDHENNDPKCRPGGSFTRMMRMDEQGRQVVDQAVVTRLNEAVRDFGRPDGVSTR